MQHVHAVDFETFYDKTYSLRKMNSWGYVFHPQFNAYLVAVHGDTVSWTGEPRLFNWEQLRGDLLVMHNMSFDRVILLRLVRDGVIPQDLYDSWRFFDTADMAAFLRVNRNLKDAAHDLLGVKMSKVIRNDMEGKTPEDAKAQGFWEALVAYSGEDAKQTYALWKKKSSEWPVEEQEISELNFLAGIHGVNLDGSLIDSALRTLEQQLFDARLDIPWAIDHPPLSTTQLRLMARQVNIEDTPAKFDAKDPVYLAWEAKHARQYPWIKAVRDFRRINIMLSRVKSLKSLRRDDGTMPIQVKYHGSHTGRFSAGSGEKETAGKFNPQNMPREALFGVDIRNMLTARPGHKFIICDYAQIEARILLWRVGDLPALAAIRKEGNLYQAYAKSKGYYSGDNLKAENKQLYQWVKACVLQLGYGCGWEKFLFVANSDLFKLGLSEESAQTAVHSFRDNNPLIVQHWYRHTNALQLSVSRKDDSHGIELPSGRALWYYDLYKELGKWKDGSPKWDFFGYPIRGANPIKLYGAKCTENEIQAIARDVLRDAWREVMKPQWQKEFGWHVVLNVHDELVFEVPDSTVEAASATIPKLMQVASTTWAQGCPIEVESHVTARYEK